MSDQKFVCDGCGDPHPYDPSIAIFEGVITTANDMERQVSPGRYCPNCAPFIGDGQV